jgi:hypothetical protein
MHRRTVKRADPSALQAALNTEPDYSKAFTHEVAILAHAIEEVCRVPVEHDDDMNYSAAQRLVGDPRDSHAVYRLLVLVSSKGSYFTFVTLHLSDSLAEGRGPCWIRLANEEIPDEIKKLQKKAAGILEAKHYTLLEGIALAQEAEGHLTGMDGTPATVFEVLFSEVC